MKTILQLLSLLCLLGCSSSPFKKEAIELNNKATQLFLTNPDSALILFDQAITLDSSYHLPIQNKANLLIQMHRYEEGLVAVEELLQKKEYAEALQMKGMLLERVKKSPEEARLAYEKALDLFQSRLDTTPQNKKALENMSIAMTYYLLGDTIQAKKLLLENKKEAKDLGMGDSILNHLSNKQHIINLILK